MLGHSSLIDILFLSYKHCFVYPIQFREIPMYFLIIVDVYIIHTHKAEIDAYCAISHQNHTQSITRDVCTHHENPDARMRVSLAMILELTGKLGNTSEFLLFDVEFRKLILHAANSRTISRQILRSTKKQHHTLDQNVSGEIPHLVLWGVLSRGISCLQSQDFFLLSHYTRTCGISVTY